MSKIEHLRFRGLTCKREQLRRRSTSATKVGWGWSWRTIGPRGGRRGYPAGSGGSKKGRVWGSGLPEGARRPAGGSAGEGHQGRGATAAISGMAGARVAGDGRGGRRGGGTPARPLSWEIGGGGYAGMGEGGEGSRRGRGGGYIRRRLIWRPRVRSLISSSFLRCDAAAEGCRRDIASRKSFRFLNIFYFTYFSDMHRLEAGV